MRLESKFPKQFVASGSFVVSKQKRAILEAYLGTCVGVTLCDEEGKVGGLVHLLLPEPTTTNNPWRAESYATTGLPLSIKALRDSGAKTNRLKASIAGGALVGPVSRADLALDIGGRTTEIVQTILQEERIPIKKAETGGFFGCRLSLDLQKLESSIDPLCQHMRPESVDFQKPTPGELEKAIQMVRPIPQVALKITRTIHNGNYGMLEVSDEIKKDQIISARVIKLCNSTFTGSRRHLDSIDRALVILGEKALLKLVISASLELYFADSGQGYSLCKGGLFQHALRTAIVAEELAKFTGKASPDVAYTAGLLHDIGKVVLDQYISSVYPFFYRRTQIDGVELCETENEKIGATHTEVGGLLAENWSLPENLADTIRHHHYPERATVDPDLTHLVYLADLLLSRFVVGQELECLNMDNLSSRLQRLGLLPSQFPVIVDLIPKKVWDGSLSY